jgi:hypothetical protein
MSCPSCEEFDVIVELRSPGELARVIGKVRTGVEAHALRYEPFESDRELIGQVPFPSIAVNGPWPDFMRYHFTCRSCRTSFLLEAETYHGAGGTWRPSAPPSNPLLQRTATPPAER